MGGWGLRKRHPIVKEIYNDIPREALGQQGDPWSQKIWKGDIPNKIKCFN